MMLVDRPWPGHRLAAALRIGRATRPDRDLALGILATRDRPDLVVHEPGMPAEHGLDGRIHGTEQRVHGTVAAALGGVADALERQRHVALRGAAMAAGDAPALERDGRVDLERGAGGLLADERDEVRVRDLLLDVGQGDGRAVDRVQRRLVDIEAEVLELALRAHDDRTACRRSADCPPGPPTGASSISKLSGFLSTPSWWMPDSWAKALRPTMALLGWMTKPGQIADQPAGGRDLLAHDTRWCGRRAPRSASGGPSRPPPAPRCRHARRGR